MRLDSSRVLRATPEVSVFITRCDPVPTSAKPMVSPIGHETLTQLWRQEAVVKTLQLHSQHTWHLRRERVEEPGGSGRAWLQNFHV